MHVEDSPYLFVYGTLRSGIANAWSQFLAAAATHAGSGRARGILFELDGYPGMIEGNQESDWVVGEVLRLNDPANTWPALDEYEGCGPTDPMPHDYHRMILPIRMDDGAVLDAWVYVYRPDTSGRRRIPSGDYLQP